jgi:carbon catabolite-derepressing protein kinase
MGSIPQSMGGSRPQVIATSTDSERTRQGSTSSSQITSIRSPISTIGVLPSSTPEYHKAYMKGHPKPPPRQEGSEARPPAGLSEEDREKQARRLRPNFRAAPDQSRQRPEPMTSLPAKKSRPTKWQFGIRSENQPAEVMLAIFKAMKAMGAEWEMPKIHKAGGRGGSQSRSGSQDSRHRSLSGSAGRSRSSSILSSSPPEEYVGSDDEYASKQRELSVRNGHEEGQPSRGRARKHYNASNDWGYDVPEDPWVINARFRKDGMFPPGVLHPSSTHSSRADLHDAGLRRRSSTNTSHSSLNYIDGMTSMTTAPETRARAGSTAGDSTTGSTRYPPPDEAVYIYMSIQLYSIQRDYFVVDFRCAGYERLVSNLVREIKASSASSTSISQLGLNNPSSQQHQQHADGWDDERGVWRRLGPGDFEDEVRRELREGEGVDDVRERTEEVGAGRKDGDKKCTSPFPFLDVASALILQLARKDE